MPDLVSFKGSEFEFNGEFFTGEPAVKLKNNLSREVRKLANNGKRSVVATIEANVGQGERAKFAGRRSTGFTARSIEVFQKPRNSLYAKVRVRPNARRPRAKATTSYPAKRIPYIVMAVLETGRQGGKHVNRVNTDLWRGRARYVRRWQHGKRTRKPLFAFRRAATEARRAAPAIRDRVTKGLA